MKQLLKALFVEKKDISGNLFNERAEGYYVDQTSGIIHFKKMIDRSLYKFSTYERDLHKAKIFANKELKKKIKNPETAKPRTLIKDEIKKIRTKYHLGVESGHYAKRTAWSAETCLNKIELFWGNLFPEDITIERWTEFQSWYHDKYKGGTQFNVTKFMRILIAHMIESDILYKRLKIRNRFAKQEEIRRKRKKARIYSPDELKVLYQACLKPNTRNYILGELASLIFLMGLEMAFRISDCVQLTWERTNLNEDHPELKKKNPDLNIVLPTISFQEGDDKADHEGDLPISDNVYWKLLDLKKSATSKWVFPQKSDSSKHIATQQIDWPLIRKEAGVKHGTFHTLRHVRLTHDFKDTRYTAAQVMIIRRVSYEVARKHYIHVSNDDLRLMRNSGAMPL